CSHCSIRCSSPWKPRSGGASTAVGSLWKMVWSGGLWRNERRSEEDGTALHEQRVQRLLNGLPDSVREVEDQHRVLGRGGLVLVRRDRRPELDQPFARQWDQAEQSQPGP